MGAAYFSYKDYRIGTNSEWIRHAIQNVAIHGTFIANQRMFEMQSGNWNGYSQYKTSNIFTSWQGIFFGDCFLYANILF